MKPFIFAASMVIALCGAATDLRAGEITVTADDLTRMGTGPFIAKDIQGLPAVPGLPVVDPNRQDEAAAQLRRLVARGQSQGFGGILYDNRDRDHSILSKTLFPNLTFLDYGPELVTNQLDYGLAGNIFIPALVFGNSSTALTAGGAPRSLPRLAMTIPGGAAAAYRDYTSNSLYVYPEHRDYDGADLFPANWPYQLISQGSSGSDRPLLEAVAMTLAAFPAETRATLVDKGLVVPTVQMILRRNLTQIRTRDQYMSGAAHPAVFEKHWLQPTRMIAHAAGMLPQDIPPVVKLKVTAESFTTRAGVIGQDERLFTTPSAIARIWRNHGWLNEMIVSADQTEDPNGRDLTFHWVVLQGDPQRIRVEPTDERGTSARIRVLWHPPFTLHPRVAGKDNARSTSRVDIGVFASNGVSDSAPAIISISFPTHQERAYEVTDNERVRLKSIDYDARGRGRTYDPVLHWSAQWRDKFMYGDDGSFLGWTRITGDQKTVFKPDGLRQDGTPFKYELAERKSGKPILTMVAPEAD
ncbi:hypothetical protein ACXYMO_06850 [Arenibacterium sp. CAU 1754]